MKSVGIILFNNVELMDFAGPYEVFSVASELHSYQLFNVFTIAEEGNEIKSVNGLKIIPDYSFTNHPAIDILIIPGGVGSKAEMEKEQVLNWLREITGKSMLAMSVCSGARLLAMLGLLNGIECTTHHEVIDEIKALAPKAVINTEARFTGCGKIYTSAGISAGIDLSLYIVEKICGVKVADKTRIYMEYGDWKKY